MFVEILRQHQNSEASHPEMASSRDELTSKALILKFNVSDKNIIFSKFLWSSSPEICSSHWNQNKHYFYENLALSLIAVKQLGKPAT
jgi:hypothetical protein